jgi:hypothetical protein
MLKMATEDEPAPIKKPRSEAQVQSLNKARAKARELRTKRNMFREKHNISDDTDATPIDETENTETESNSETTSSEDEQSPAEAVVDKNHKRQIQHQNHDNQNLHDKQLLINHNKKMNTYQSQISFA